MSSTGTQCQATKKNGRRCAAYALHGSRFCFWHDPDAAERRAAARSAGGRARHGRCIGNTGNCEPAALRTPDDVLDVLERTVNDLLALENSIARARALAYVAGSAYKVIEGSELKARLDALECVLRTR